MTSGFGKIILLGEHAVVYGYPAIAGAIDRTVAATVTTRQQLPTTKLPTTLRAPAWDLSVATDGDDSVAVATRAILAELCPAALEDRPIDIEIETSLPAAAGLGSSAALCVSVTRAVAEHVGRQLHTHEVEAIASAGETVFHAQPSGVDVAIAARGGLGRFTREAGLEPIPGGPIRLVVGLSGQPRRTGDMVNRVRDQVTQAPDRTNPLLAELGNAATAGARSLAAGDNDSLADAMSRAQRGLRQLGLSTSRIDVMVDAATTAGALAAKLTGAGGGGAVIALAPGAEQEVQAAWTRLGCQAFTCNAGVAP